MIRRVRLRWRRRGMFICFGRSRRIIIEGRELKG